MLEILAKIVKYTIYSIVTTLYFAVLGLALYVVGTFANEFVTSHNPIALGAALVFLGIFAFALIPLGITLDIATTSSTTVK